MPKLTRSGDVFRIGANGEFDGTWFTSGRVRGSAGITFDGGVEFCHGLAANAKIEASADIEGALTVFLPSVRAEGQAFAALGAGIKAQLAPNIFEKVGLTLDAHAFAQASVAGRIGLALDFTEIAGLAEDALSDLAYNIFIAFLNEIELEAGVWGRASFAAMAEVHLEINGTVLGEDPGFQIALGGGAGWGGGTAWDFYGKVGLEDPKRLYTTVSELLIAELALQARQRVDPPYRPAVEVFEFIAPLAAATAYDLGEIAAEEILRPANQSVMPFLQTFGQRAALYTLDKVVELGTELLASALMDALAQVLQRPFSEADKQALTSHINDAITLLGNGPLELDTAVEVITPITDILTLLAPDLVDRWDNEIALLWSAAAMARALRRGAASAGVTLDVLGLGGSISGSVLAIPPAPEAVLRAYASHFGTPQTAPEFDDVVDYLSGQALETLLPQYVPLIDATLGELARVLGLTLGDLIEAVLTGALGEDLTQTDLYVQLRDYAKNAIDSVVLTELIPEMRSKVSDNPEAVEYIDEVIVPVLTGTSEFAFRGIDTMVAGISVNSFDPFNQTFKTGLSDLVWQFFSRNIVFLTGVLTDSAVNALNTGFQDLEATARSDAATRMMTDAIDLGQGVYPAFRAGNSDHVLAMRDLVADLLGAGATAFGPAIWTHTRRDRLKELTRILLERDVVGDYAKHDEVDLLLKELGECFGVSDAVNVKNLLVELFALTVDEFEVVTERVIPALEIFFLRLSTGALDQIETQAVAFISGLAARLQELLDALQQLARDIEQLAQDIAEFGGLAAAALSTLATELGSQGWRASVLNALLAKGMDIAEANTRAGPGFDLMSSAAQATAVQAARGAFRIAFGAVRGALDLALQFSSGAIGTAALGLDTATSVPLAATGLINALAADLRAQVTAAGIVLPNETSIADVEAAIIAALDTSVLRALIETYVENRRAELDATAELDALEDDEARQRAELARERKLQQGLPSGPPEVHILSPAAFDPARGFVYPRIVPVHVTISGAHASYLEPGNPQRTMVRLNGAEIVLEDGAWTAEGDELTLTGRITEGLTEGLNVLEVSIADGLSERVRGRVSFLANPALEPRGTGFRVAPELSQIDAPGNDHKALLLEWVALQNTGSDMLELEGLRIADRVGHTYVFGPRTLPPGAVVRLRTGKAGDTASDVHWGRGAAVWNNRGDTVYAFDADRVLWAETRVGGTS